MINVMSVDVEDYFHPSEVQATVSPSQWNSMVPRVEEATARTLDLLAARKTRATFFILGWVAHRFPALVRRISAAGHEIACHSYSHQLVFRMSEAEFRSDTETAVKAIEDACGLTPRAYRAPSYSITSACMWALDVLVECGFTCDSSIYPIVHDRYGIPGFSRHAKVVETRAGKLLEVPIATVRVGRAVSPVGGGAYLRLLPYRYTAAGIRRLNSEERQPACIYFHPWEIDPGQPRIASGLLSRFRTYAGTSKMSSKIDRLLGEFQFSTLSAVYPAGPAVVAA